MASVMAGIEALKATHQQLKTKMDSTVEDFRGHLLSARTGRAGAGPRARGRSPSSLNPGRRPESYSSSPQAWSSSTSPCQPPRSPYP